MQKKQAKEWKIQLDETIAKLRMKEEEVEVLHEHLRGREIYVRTFAMSCMICCIMLILLYCKTKPYMRTSV